VAACSGSEYTGQYFSYPPSSKPYENNWTYIGNIVVWGSSEGSVCKLSKKIVRIAIEDKKGRELLSDKLEFNKGCIRSTIEWSDFSKVVITLSEEGNKYTNDDYNRKLLKMGANRFKVLTYNFNESLNKFVRKEKEKGTLPFEDKKE